MKVGWLQDNPGYIGGAELTCAEFRQARPHGVEIIDCPPGEVKTGLDAYVAHNVIHYSAEDLAPISFSPLAWYHHDLSPHVNDGVRSLLNENAQHIYCSPLQRDKYGIDGECVPPALNLKAFRPNRQHRRNGEREGTCSIAQWRGPGKGATLLADWAEVYGPVKVYGEGAFLPHGPNIELMGPLDPAAVPQTLRQYEAFVFLPFEVEPFCRTVAEAWAAGCDIVTNDLIGARYWIEENPKGLETAASDFWEAVL